MQKFHKRWLLPTLSAAAALLLFSLLLFLVYRYDNKYTAGPPYGEKGVFSFSEADLSSPLFLIDGWMLDDREVFIGQYSNFSYLPGRESPFGSGIYTLTLRFDGAPRTLLLEVPVIFTQYALAVNGVPAAVNTASQIAVTVGGGDTLLTLTTENHSHYYSGLTYPPALGTPETIGRLFFLRTLVYAALCFSALTLSLFSMSLWFSRYRNQMFFHFGLLSLFFSVHCAHPLVWQFGGSGQLWYIIEDVSWLLVLAEAMHLAALSAHLTKAKWYRLLLRPAMLLICLLCAVFIRFVIPSFGGFIRFYGVFIDGYKIFAWAFLAVCAGMGLLRENPASSLFVSGAASILGVSVLIDVMDSNQYEPIYGLWQNEYTGALLVLLFGCLMARRTHTLLRESEELRLLSIQYRFAEESASQMRDSIRQVRAMKHELNHHIEALSALCEKGDFPRLVQYLNQLRADKNALPMLSYSNHFLINAMMVCYLEPARRNGIQTECRILVPDELPLPDAELCTLLSNLLQNATEACMTLPRARQGFIRFDMTLKDSLLNFVCVNPAPPGDSSGPFPTTKRDALNHGLGLFAISQIAQKHNGTVRAERLGGVFTVRGVLSLPL